ncbi:MAG: MBL fold metallo-hydrolase [Myxococcota bacterium]
MWKTLGIGFALLVLVVGGVFWFSDDARHEANLRAAEMAGEVATGFVRRQAGSSRAADFINIPVEVRELASGVYQARGVGNVHLIATDEGHVVYDTGLATQAAKQKRLLEEAVPEGDVTHVVVSHSHQDHAGGAKFWVRDGVELVAHREFSEEQRYLKELEDYLFFRNRTLFPWMPESAPKSGPFVYGGDEPTILVDDLNPLVFEQGGVRFEVLSTPGAEGADNICLWLPDQKILFSGDFFGPIFPQFPNVFTMRGEKVRKPIEYIRSLDLIIALEPEMIVPSHKDPVTGREEILSDLRRMRDAVRHVHDAVVAGMNGGKTVYELMEEITLPPHLELTQAHGRVSWAVKSIWEYYATWFHFDTTTELYPVPARALYGDIAAAAGSDTLVERAQLHLDAGRPVHALHLLDIVVEAEPRHQRGQQVRRAALERLLDDAQELGNSYEIDWLHYRIRLTDEALGDAA